MRRSRIANRENRVLRAQDATAMRAALANDPEGRAEVVQAIAVALNTRQLVPEGGRPVFP